MGYGPGDVLQLIRSGRATTRSEILVETGMSRVTVTQRIEALRTAGLIRAAGDGAATGGRRATTFVFDPDTVIAVAALDLESGRVALADAHGEILASREIVAPLGEGPPDTLAAVTGQMASLMDASGITQDRLEAVGLSVPGPIDPVSQRLVEPPIMPAWNGWPIVESIRERFDTPVYLENDADAMAYGEWGLESDAATRPFFLVKVSEFIGGGIVLDGRIFRGYDGGAGDIGHVFVGGDQLCRCGRRGCLATEASGDAVVTRLQSQGVPVESVPDIARLVATGDARVTGEVHRAGELIGQVLGTVVGVLNPASLVVSGALASTALVASIRTAVYASTLPRATRHLDIRQGRLGDSSALTGLARVAVADVFSAAQVDQRLSRS
ncbi:MAG: ROK family protein [Arachnia sp.]